MTLPKRLRELAGNTYSYRCNSGKRRYATYQSAYMEFERIRALPEEKRGKAPRNIYRCPSCGGFHLTSMEKR